MNLRVAAVFCMPERGHLQRLLPLIAGLAARGVMVRVFTAADFRAAVERAGGHLVDLFARYPLEAADATSRPVPCRYVSFAAHYADALLDEMARVGPAVIVYDTFAVIGLLLGRALGVPYVNVCAGHNMSPANAVALLVNDRRVALSDACHRAVDVLRDRWGILDASPFAYYTGVSPFMNVYCEPPEFLGPEERASFRPVVFFGSLPSAETDVPDAQRPDPSWGRLDGRPLRMYASFGSVVWRYFESEAVAALTALAEAIAGLDHARALISLGGYPLRPAARVQLERYNVRVADYVDQWNVLRDASVCLTHNGLNSTHEMIYHRVPMISYPFFGDQPALAARCQDFGCAVPLGGALRGAVSARDVHTALGRLREESAFIAASLARARRWEVGVMRGRHAVIQQILDLMSGG